MSTDPTRPTRAEIAEQVRVVRAAGDDVDALLAAAPSAPADQAIARYRSAWLSARQRAAVLCAEVTRRAPLLGEYAAENTRLHQWHDEDRAALTEMRATIERLRTERDSFRDQRNAVFATNEQLHAQVLESDQARLRAENDTRTAKREAAPPAPADQNLRDRIRRAVCEAEGFAWDSDMLEPDEYGEVADTVLAVLPAAADRDVALSETHQRMLGYALDLADDEAATDGSEITEDEQDALAELRRITAMPAPADQAPPLLAEVWTVWCEDESAWGHFATEGAGKTGTIDYYEEQEERCPDYGWQQDGSRLELLAGGEPTGIYLSRHPVYGKPPSVDRADLLREAADAIVAEFPGPELDRYTRYAADFLRRKADEAPQSAPRPPITNYVVEIYDADEWLISNARTDDLDSSRAKLRARRNKWPDMPLRIVRSVETYTVVEVDAPTACVSAPCSHPGDCRHGCRAAADQLTQLGQDMQAGEGR